MFHEANCQDEPKMMADLHVVPLFFQKHSFRPCVGLSCWVRWGPYIFDIRPLRDYLRLPQENKSYRQHTIYWFHKRIKEITDAVGDHDFIRLNQIVNRKIAADQEAILEQNKTKGVTDDLPF